MTDVMEIPASRSAAWTLLPITELKASRSLTSPLRTPSEACVP